MNWLFAHEWDLEQLINWLGFYVETSEPPFTDNKQAITQIVGAAMRWIIADDDRQIPVTLLYMWQNMRILQGMYKEVSYFKDSNTRRKMNHAINYTIKNHVEHMWPLYQAILEEMENRGCRKVLISEEEDLPAIAE